MRFTRAFIAIFVGFFKLRRFHRHDHEGYIMDGISVADRPRNLTGKPTWPIGWWYSDETYYQLDQPLPTNSLPGTAERLQVYYSRMLNRQEMFCKLDAWFPEDHFIPHFLGKLEMPEDWWGAGDDE